MKRLTSSDKPCPICKPHRHAPPRPNTVDDLDPPIISDAVRPIDGAERGLGIRHLKPWLIVHLLRWVQLKKGDIFKVYMGSSTFALASDEVREEDLDKTSFSLVIDGDLVPKGYVYPCFIEVVRFGSGTTSRSPFQTWYTKETRPGGVSTTPYYHSRLIIHLPPDLVDEVLDPERAKEGVDLTIDPYPNMTLGDTIEVWWNGYPVFIVIDQDHIDGYKPIVVHVTEAIIIAGGNGLVVIYFRVFDTVFNYSGEVRQWSKPVRVETDLNKELLDRAHFTVDDDSVDELNYDEDGGKSLKIEVVIPRTLPNGMTTPAGALIYATLTQIDSDGIRTPITLPPFAARIGRSATTPVDKKYVEPVIGGHLEIEYTLKTVTGGFLGTSRRLNVTVIGERRSMPAMTCDQDEGGYIDPEQPYIRLNFPAYTPYNRDYSVTLRMEAQGPGGRLIEYEEKLLAGPPAPPERFRIVFKEQFERFVGLQTRIFYLVEDGRVRIMGSGIQTVRRSDTLELTFGTVSRSLPKPQMQYVDSFNNLDPDSIIGAQVKVTLTYTRTVPGDTFHWTLQGMNSDGTARDDITLNSGTAGRPVEFSLDSKYVIANKNGEFRLSYALVPANGSATLHSEQLIVTVGQALDLLRPEVLQATRYPDQLAPLAALGGATIEVRYAQMRPTHRIEACWSGIPGVGTYCETQDGNTSKVLHFNVPAEVVGANIQARGHFIQAQYNVILGQHRVSSPALNLELLPLSLPNPYLEGHSQDAVLKTNELNGTERALVDRWHFIHHFQWVWYEMFGTYADDSAFYHAFSYPAQVGLDGEQNGLNPLAPISELRKLKDGTQLSMRCAVTFDQSTYLSNAVAFAPRDYTINALPAHYPVPRLIEASGSGTSVILAALNAQNGVHVEVSYGPMNPSDIIHVEVLGTAGAGSAVIGPISGEADGTVIVPLSSALIAANIGNSDTQFTIRYTVTKGSDTRPSTLLTVKLQTLPQSELKKTLIKIDEATSANVIELDTLIGDATARVTTWAFIALFQPVWLQLLGTDRDGNPHNLTLLDGSVSGEVDAAWLSQGYHLKAVLNSYLHDLGNRSQLTMQFKVALNGKRDELQAIEFPAKRYTVNSVMIHDCTRFTDNYVNNWLSEWPDVGVRREPDGNFFWQSGPNTGSGVRL